MIKFIKRIKLKNKLNKELSNIHVSKKAMYMYKNTVRGNSLEDDELLIKKIKRNWILGTIRENTERSERRNYGNLIMNGKTNKKGFTYIRSIHNIKNGKRFRLKIDIEVKDMLNKILKIEV